MPIKRAAAMVSQFHSLLSTLHLLSEVKLLISIIGLADEQAFREKDAVRVSGRIVELL